MRPVRFSARRNSRMLRANPRPDAAAISSAAIPSNSASDITGCWGTPSLFNNDQTCKRAFNSEHPSAANWVLGDGSVRSISYNVDINLLQNMGTMAGGETAVVPQ